MRRSSLFLIGLLISPVSWAYDLEQHLWQHRLLVLAAPSDEDPNLQRQRDTVRERNDAIVDRDLRVFELVGKLGWRDGEPLDAGDATALRRHFDLEAESATMILVGLDGGEKRRAPLGSDLRELFMLIDGMPMRRSDMRAKRAAGQPVTEP